MAQLRPEENVNEDHFKFTATNLDKTKEKVVVENAAELLVRIL